MNAEPTARAKFGAAYKHLQTLANGNPALFEKAQEIMRKINNGEILWMAGIMVALQEGQKMAADNGEMASLPSMAQPVIARRTRTRS